MTDIVERLHDPLFRNEALCVEAADEIERLRAALLQAKRELGCYLQIGGTPPTTRRAFDACECALNIHEHTELK